MLKKVSIFIFLVCFLNECFAEYLPLNGLEWIASNQNESIKVKAKVPGSIYSDLRREGILDESIYKGYNDLNYRWVSYDDWTYERRFNVDSKLLSKESVLLVAEGMDTISDIYINGKHIAKTDNMFIRYELDVKDVLKSGENEIKVVFQSAPLYAKSQANEYLSEFGYSVPPECSNPRQKGECHYNFIRKMQASFSWDWGPAVPTQGIWKSIGIEARDGQVIRDVTIRTESERDLWTLYVKIILSKEVSGLYEISLDGHQIYVNKTEPNSDESAEKVLVIPIKDVPIIPWYPNGVANDTQNLYHLNVSFTDDVFNEVSNKVIKIGFREIELIEDPLKPEGMTFYFKVNGQPIYAKGSNWIPANVLMEDLTEEYVKHILLSAKQANMNVLRVWGGGVYESELFYGLADELGIMIWQDFMFACALYPTDPQFLKSVDTEVRQQVRRLQYHPSILIWAGNNENEGALMQPWYPIVKTNETVYHNDYIDLYIRHIREIVISEDTTRPFVGSSPSNGLHELKEDIPWLAAKPYDPRYGDIHFYNDLAKLWDWKSFPSPKFASEYGFQSYPSLQALSDVLDENDLIYPISEALEHRQHGSGTTAIPAQAANYFTLPSNGGKERLNDLIYLSQITQAMAMKTETEFYRRNRDVDPETGNGYTMGALYWQINDIWEAPTWASIEFGGKWKPLHSYAIAFLNNLLISPFEDNNELKVSLVRDDFYGELEFDLSIKVYNWSQNKPIHEIQSKVTTDSFSAKIVYSKSIPELLKESKCLARSECVLSFQVKSSEHKLQAQNFMLLTEPKNSTLIDPDIKVVDVKKRGVENEVNVFDIELSSAAIAPFVLLDFKLNTRISGQFIENGFFIFDGQKTIRFETKSDLSESQIKDNLTIKTVTHVK